MASALAEASGAAMGRRWRTCSRRSSRHGCASPARTPGLEVVFAREFAAGHGFGSDAPRVTPPGACLHPNDAAQRPLAGFLLDAITAEPMDAPPR